jgi:acyl-CoA thioesterase I
LRLSDARSLNHESSLCAGADKLANTSTGAPYEAFIAHNARPYWGLYFIISLCVALLSACSKAPSLPTLDANATILAFGDSLTFGTGAVSNESYPSKLQSLISRKVIAAGVPGEVSADGLARLPQALEEHQPKLLILCHGGNDFLRKLGEAQTKSNVRAMLKLALDKGISVVLIATPKPGLIVKTPEFYKEIASEFAIPFDDAMLKKVLTDNELKSDLVHPNAKGYSHIAEQLAKLLKRAGAI